MCSRRDTDNGEHTVPICPRGAAIAATYAAAEAAAGAAGASAWTPSQVPMPFKARWNCQVRRVSSAPLASWRPAAGPRTTLPIHPTAAPARARPAPAAFLLLYDHHDERSRAMFASKYSEFTTDGATTNTRKSTSWNLTKNLTGVSHSVSYSSSDNNKKRKRQRYTLVRTVLDETKRHPFTPPNRTKDSKSWMTVCTHSKLGSLNLLLSSTKNHTNPRSASRWTERTLKNWLFHFIFRSHVKKFW